VKAKHVTKKARFFAKEEINKNHEKARFFLQKMEQMSKTIGDVNCSIYADVVAT
jgi:hypothetical protein